MERAVSPEAAVVPVVPLRPWRTGGGILASG
jgi:hypothetical protein